MNYIGEDGKEHRPYMVHRALLGSFERFFGVLTEHFAGAFPTWLAPKQVAILPVSDKFWTTQRRLRLSYANFKCVSLWTTARKSW